MTIGDIAEKFGVGEDVVKAWMTDGLPAGEGVEVLDVAAWLYQKGLIDTFKMTVHSQAAVAKFFGVTLDTVRKNWVTDIEFPVIRHAGRHNHYPLHKIAEWKAKRRQDPGRSENTGEWQLKKREAEARIKMADAESKEIRLQRERGEILYRNQIEPVVAEVINGTKLLFRRIPEEMMPFFPKEQRVELAQEMGRQIDATLHRMADWLTSGVEQAMSEEEDE